MQSTEPINTKGLLFSAYQKLYSALSNLEKFEKGTNFFDNISHLDNFFSEFRNVTFMIQKSLAHTEFLKIYDEKSKKYFHNDASKWFVHKRNEVLKEQPFDLEKKIRIVIYTTTENVILSELSFTVENDIEFSTLIDSMQEFFASFHLVEVMFSAEFSFYEKGHSEELYDNFISGINNMKLFMEEMKEELKENCSLSDQIENRINELNFHRIPKNMLLIDDYVYYIRKNLFEKASRAEFVVGLDIPKIPLSIYDKLFPEAKDMFEKFMMQHLFVFQKQKAIMSTCFILFNDQTMKFMSFESSIKTTVYRKFHEIAQRIEKEGIIAVYFVCEMYNYNNAAEIFNMESKDRVKYKSSESLVFIEVNQDATIRSFSFDKDKIDDEVYIASVLQKNDKTYNNLAFMNPVINEFMSLNQKKEGS